MSELSRCVELRCVVMRHIGKGAASKGGEIGRVGGRRKGISGGEAARKDCRCAR